MKKSTNKNNQRTLFQSWGKQSTLQTKTTAQANQQNHELNPVEIIDLGDEDEDDGLLAAALEIEAIGLTTNDANIDPQTTTMSTDVSVVGNNESETKEIEILPGFDMESGNVWIYPINYPVRNYQFQIVEKALFSNTLVTLPTGLGKTFIAAVLMYNYYRWYPQGKVIFMAPTKPLVAQQIEACYNIMGIPESDTAQMTGITAPSKREILWKSKRVFFLTAQVLQNDLGRGSCNAEQVVLLVFDEAHKALGNHAYSQVVREIHSYTKNFRVLALSATPGDDIKAVQQVMSNLLISHMELRSEDSPDIQPYTHSRTVEKIVVPLGEDINKIKTQFLKVLETIVGRLYCKKVLWQKDPKRVTKFMLLSGREQFRKKDAQGYTNGQKGAIESDFAMAISLYHAYELLHQHGILSFYNFIKAIMDGSKGMARARSEMMRHAPFVEVMDELRDSIERPPDDMDAETSALFSQFTSPRRKSMMKEAFDPSFRSHPKLLKLEEVIVDHFKRFNENIAAAHSSTTGTKAKPSEVNTRVMIFSQYRDSVGEITAILNKHKPLVRVMSFIGQASTGKSSRGLSQKEQLEVVQRFRRGGYNTIVATCVGEEGLDIGDVDLIVCFDAHASPIRLVQRMGRTGRKRDGRIVVLVSEGKEEQVYKRSLSSKKSIHKAIVQGSKSFELYDENPRMIPRHLTPRALKMEMTVGEFVGNNKRKRKSEPSADTKGSISNFLSNTKSKSSTMSRKDDGMLTYDELVYWKENFKLPNYEAGTTPSRKRTSHSSAMEEPLVKELSLNEWMPWQNVPSPVYKIAHSRRTQHLVEILGFIELQSGDDDSYDVEMMSFLNEEDLLGGNNDSDKSNGDVIIMDHGDDDIFKLGHGKKDNGNAKTKRQKAADVNGDDVGKKKSESPKDMKQYPKQKSKEKKISPQRKWKEYLKAFENKDDDDFEPFDKADSSMDDDQDSHSETETCGQRDLTENKRPKVVTTSFSDNPPGNRFENGEMEEVKTPEKDEDPLEISSQNFSQLLPSTTPHNTHTLRSKVSCIENLATHIPLPPSLDSLNELSPFTPTKSTEEGTYRRGNPDKIACRRNIQKDSKENETESTLNIDFGDEKMKSEKIGCENNETCNLGNYFLSSLNRNNPVLVAEPPDAFDDCDDFLLEDSVDTVPGLSENRASALNVDKKLTEMHTLRKDRIPDEPPSTFYVEESQIHSTKAGGKEGKLENQGREIPQPPKLEDFDESFDLLKSDYRTPKKFSLPVFGDGVVCNSGTKSMDDDMEIAFGDDSLADYLFAEFADLNPDERCLKADREKSNSSEIQTNSDIAKGKTPKMEVYNAEDAGLSKHDSFLKLGIYEQNKRSESNPSKCNNLNQSPHSISTTNKESTISKTLGSKTKSENPLVPREQDGFQFKKPSALKLNRCSKSPGNSRLAFSVQRDVTGDSAQTSPLRTSPMTGLSKLSLKKNLNQRHEPKSPRVEKRPSPRQKENHSVVTLKSKRSCSDGRWLEDGPVRGGHQPVSKMNNQAEESPRNTQWNLKPLRERISFQGPNRQQIDEKNQCSNNDDGSPIIRKRPKSKNVPMISSPSCDSPSTSNVVDIKDEESPLIRRRSKIKTKNGNVVAIAESDDDDEEELGDDNPTKPTASVKSFHSEKVQGESMSDKNKKARGRFLESDSEEEFLGNRTKSGNAKPAASAKRKIEVQSSIKRKRAHSRVPPKKQRTHRTNAFLDDEAELSGSDIEDFSDEESDKGDEFDSFIDDSTQLTQRTPTPAKHKNCKSRAKIGDIYRQSLMSPFARDLNFRTPRLCLNKNRYKMKFKPGTIGEGSASEAEETYERESDLENELSFGSQEECDTVDDDDDNGNDEDVDENDDHDISAHSDRDSTPRAATHIRRPLKRLKRKRILNDSMDEDPVDDRCNTTPSQSPHVPSLKSRLSRGINPQNTSKATSKQPLCVPSSSPYTTQDHTQGKRALAKVLPTYHSEPRAMTPEGDSNQKPSQPSPKEVPNSRKNSKEDFSTTFEIDWGLDFSDSDLLGAMEGAGGDANHRKKACSSKEVSTRKSSKGIAVCDQEMQEIAFAMDSTDDAVTQEMSEMPTFSLGFDFFGDFEGEEDDMTLAAQTTTPTANGRLGTSSSIDPPNPQDANSEPKFTKIISPKVSSGRENNFNETSKRSSVPLKSNAFALQNLQRVNPTKKNSSWIGTKKETTNICNKLSLVEISTENTTGNSEDNFPQSSGTTGLKDITNWKVMSSATPKTIPTAFVTPSQKNKDKLVVLVHTKEISNSRVVSILRLKYNMKAEVCQLMHCDYAVSNRMAVIRKLASAVANGANSTKILNKMRILCDLYDRPAFIIEKDRVKTGETQRDYSRSNAYVYILACMAQTHIKVLFSESQEETASLLAELVALEARKSANIVVPLTMNKETQQVFRFLLTIPRVSYVTALNMCSSLRTLRDLISSSPADLQKTSRQLSESRATAICSYIRHMFDENMAHKETNKSA